MINDLTGKIAVLYRNSCDFATKAWNAQVAGAVAVIVINREDDVALGMSADSALKVRNEFSKIAFQSNSIFINSEKLCEYCKCKRSNIIKC